MNYIHIHSNKKDGTYCGDRLYMSDDPVKALERFFRDYPAHKACKVSVQPLDPEEGTMAKKFYEACRDCGVIY